MAQERCKEHGLMPYECAICLANKRGKKARITHPPRPPKATGVPLAWDLRLSDKAPATPLAPKTSKHSARLPSPVMREGQEEDEKRGLLKLGSDPITISRALARLRDNGKTARQIAADFNVSDGYVSQYLSLQKLVPQVQKLMDPARPESTRLHFTVAIALASVRQDLQENYAQAVLGRGWTVNKAARQIRVRAKRERAAAKLSRPAR